jgi:hypothetical protein
MEARGWSVRQSLWARALNMILPLRWRAHRSFRKLLYDNLDTSKISNEVMLENLQYVYTIRNRIVHRGYRMSINSGLFCDKAICSLYYLIYRHSGDRTLSHYVYTLNYQFTALKGFLGEMYDLDAIERRELKLKTTERPVINNPSDLETFMFTALRFTEADKRSL